MKILLDPHIFLWFIAGDARLPAYLHVAIRDSDNEVYLSVVSVWEAIIKHRLGRLPLPEAPESFLPAQRQRHGITSLAIDEASVSRLGRLPAVHRDPFDRMLVCQAQGHGMRLATVDGWVKAYPVDLL